MALTRSMLKSMNLTEEQVNAIIEAHTDTVDGLKKERDTLKAATASVDELTRERDSLREQLQKAGDAAKVQAEFDAYKQQIAKEKADALNSADLMDIAREAGVQRESFLNMIARDFDMGEIKRGEDGKVQNRAELKEAIKTRYSDCVAVSIPEGTQPIAPLSGGGGMTKESIMKIKDPVQRQNAIAQNIELFQKG